MIALIFAIASAGVPVGATIAYHAVASKPAKPASCTVITSGRLGARALDVTASARSLPSFTSGM